MTYSMTYEQAEEIVGDARTRAEWKNWTEEEYLDALSEERQPWLSKMYPWATRVVAEAYATVWRRDGDKPGFMQPRRSLVKTVEGIIGEPIWAGWDQVKATRGWIDQ